MWPPKSKKDLFHLHVECAGQHFEWNTQTGTLRPVPTLDDADFQNAVCPHVKKIIPIPNFYTDLKKVLENAIKLNVLAYFVRFDINEKIAQFQNDAKISIQKNPFKVLMPDAVSKKDKARKKKLSEQWDKNIGGLICYECDKEEIVFPFDEPACHFLAFSPGRPHVIKSTLKSQKRLKNLLEKNAPVFSYLNSLLSYFIQFYSSTEPPYTQKHWDEFLYKMKLNSSIAAYWQNTVNPSVMMLVDTSRRFLNEALMAEHWAEIAPSKQEAQLKLKKDKDLIYRLSEKYDYIENANLFLKCEQLRNDIAHPTRKEGLLPDAFNISTIYQNFVFHFIDRDFLHRYYKEVSFSFPMSDIRLQYDRYQTVRDADFLSEELGTLLPSALQDETNRKKLNFLNKNGLLTNQESQEMTQLFLQRNAVAHGQTDAQKISESLVDAMRLYHALVHRQRLLTR